MKKLYFIYFLTALFASSCSSSPKSLVNTFGEISENNSLTYFIDLTDSNSDRIDITLKGMDFAKNEVEYRFPSIIPGYYQKIDFGQFVDRFFAFDSNGNKLNVVQKDVNTFLIQNAESLDKITYRVKEAWNDKDIFKIGSTRFDESSHFLLNPWAFIGYFEGNQDLPIETIFKKNVNHFGATSLKMNINNDSIQSFVAEDYDSFIDCPILFSEPDTCSLQLTDIKLTFAVYNKQGSKIAPTLAKELLPYFKSFEKFTNDSIPVNHYTFLVYLEDFTGTADIVYNKKTTPLKIAKVVAKYGKPQFGALEHMNSSLYYMPNTGKSESYIDPLKKVVVHELLHMYTPLSLHSELVGKFNYSDPEFSKHLWLYEGVIDYLSLQAQLQSGTISLDDILYEELRPRMFQTNHFPKNLSFTEFSTRIMEEEINKHAIQVFSKGTVLAFLLDTEIMKLTNGEKNLKDVVFELVEKHGPDKPFNEDNFFNEFVAHVHPDLQKFFDKFIIGNDFPDYQSCFDVIGIHFDREVNELTPERNLGIEKRMKFADYISVNKVSDSSPFMEGDKIKGSTMGFHYFKPFRNQDGSYKKEGEEINIPVLRKGVETNVKVTVKYVPESYYYKLYVNNDMNAQQRKCFEKWSNH